MRNGFREGKASPPRRGNPQCRVNGFLTPLAIADGLLCAARDGEPGNVGAFDIQPASPSGHYVAGSDGSDDHSPPQLACAAIVLAVEYPLLGRSDLLPKLVWGNALWIGRAIGAAGDTTARRTLNVHVTDVVDTAAEACYVKAAFCVEDENRLAVGRGNEARHKPVDERELTAGDGERNRLCSTKVLDGERIQEWDGKKIRSILPFRGVDGLVFCAEDVQDLSKQSQLYDDDKWRKNRSVVTC